MSAIRHYIDRILNWRLGVARGWGLLLFLLAAGIGAKWLFSAGGSSDSYALPPRPKMAQKFVGQIGEPLPGRKIYPYSVIRGGAYSPEELARARRTDRVVAAHYAVFGIDTGLQKAASDLLVYVSYRKRDRVYWTRTRHRVPRGETLLVSGVHLARTRCGNRLELNPQAPVDSDEPDEDVLNSPQKGPGMPNLGIPEESIPAPVQADLYVPSLPVPNGLTTVPSETVSPAPSSYSGAVPNFFGSPITRVPATSGSSGGTNSGAPAATSSGSGLPVVTTSVPSAGPPVSAVPEPDYSKVMLLLLVPCLVWFKLRKSV